MTGPRLLFESTRYFLQSAIRTVIPLLQKIPCESKALRDYPAPLVADANHHFDLLKILVSVPNADRSGPIPPLGTIKHPHDTDQFDPAVMMYTLQRVD